MLTEFRAAVKKYHLLENGERVLVAVSGGADSLALLLALIYLADEYKLDLLAGHLDHGIRGRESREDTLHVQAFCDERGIRLERKSLEMHPLKKGDKFSEDLARKERYDFLRTVAHRAGATKIALGHNYHDQAETVLLNLIRGAGPAGMKGILPVRDGLYIRPLLEIKRSAITGFLNREGVQFRTDSSNDEEIYLRNRIRKGLLPVLKKHYNANIEDHLCHLAEINRLDDDCLKGQAESFMQAHLINDGRRRKIDILSIKSQHEAVIRRVLLGIFREIFPPGKEVTFRHIEKASLFLGENKAGSFLPLAKKAAIGIADGYLQILETSDPREFYQNEVKFQYEVEIPGSIFIRETGTTWRFDLLDKSKSCDHLLTDERREVHLDYERISFPVQIRNRRAGDWIQPRGMAGRKKIKSLFIDEKIPRPQRNLTPLLVDTGSVLWVKGSRLSERVKVNTETKTILKIELV